MLRPKRQNCMALGLWQSANRATNIGRVRGNGDDQKGTGSDHGWGRHAGSGRLRRGPVRGCGLILALPRRFLSRPPTLQQILEDGRPYQSLKRHLAARGLTPEAYRAKWGLPPSYPMVAPNYAQRRSDLAKARGFGQRRPAEPPATPEGKRPPSGRRGRKRAA